VHVTEYNFYVQDDWRLCSNLTINLGLHYEIDTPYYERNNQWVNFDPTSGAILVAGQNGVGRYASWKTDYGSCGPPGHGDSDQQPATRPRQHSGAAPVQCTLSECDDHHRRGVHWQ
jgi:hypothetical protein